MQISTVHRVGRYLVTPLIKSIDDGKYMASVSIRRGAHDRVFRFIPVFDSATRAGLYALTQGRVFVHSNELC